MAAEREPGPVRGQKAVSSMLACFWAAARCGRQGPANARKRVGETGPRPSSLPSHPFSLVILLGHHRLSPAARQSSASAPSRPAGPVAHQPRAAPNGGRGDLISSCAGRLDDDTNTPAAARR